MSLRAYKLPWQHRQLFSRGKMGLKTSKAKRGLNESALMSFKPHKSSIRLVYRDILYILRKHLVLIHNSIGYSVLQS